MSNWQPIETAPCDDSVVLVFWDDFYATLEDLDHDSDPTWWKKRGATHWMPLPAPPDD